jgi:hypothetical protein
MEPRLAWLACFASNNFKVQAARDSQQWLALELALTVARAYKVLHLLRTVFPKSPSHLLRCIKGQVNNFTMSASLAPECNEPKE